MVNIRGVDRTFATELAGLCTRSFTEAYADVNSETDIRAYCATNYSIAAIEANLSNPDATYRVAFKGVASVGFFLIQSQPCPVPLDGGAVELKQIYVLASEFGTGLGQLLLREAKQCVQERSNRWLWLSVSDLNHRAQAFYRKHGFIPSGPAPTLEVGNARLPATVMVCDVG